MNYSDASSFGRRKYELRQCSIFVCGTQMNGTSFELEIPYRELSPMPEKLQVYSPLFKIGLWTTLIGTVALTVVGVGQFSGAKPLFAMAYGPAIIGIVILLASLRKIEMIRFKSTGGVPAVDIVKSGKQKASYDAFVAEFQRRIQSEK